MAVANADPIKRLGLLYNSGRPHVMARENRWVIDHYAALIKGNPSHPRNSLACFYYGLAFAADGENQQALAEVTKMPPGRVGDAGALANLAKIQIFASERTAGEANLQLLLDREARGEHVVSYQIAAVYEAMGNRVEILRWLARYTEEVDPVGSWLLWLQHDPRYAAVLAKARPRR